MINGNDKLQDNLIKSADNKRLQSVDIAKGLGIIGIVWLHVIGSNSEGFLGNIFSILFICFGGVLGIFFFLSGYFYKLGNSYIKNVIHRTKNLLLPTMALALVVCIIGYFAEWLFEGSTSIKEYIAAYINNLIDIYSFSPINQIEYPQGYPSQFLVPIWFAYRLYFSDLIFYAVADFALKNVRNLIITITGLLTITTLYLQFISVHFLFQLECCFAYSALILLGAYCKKFELLEKLKTNFKDNKYWLIFLCGIILYAITILFLRNYIGQRLFFGIFNTQMNNTPESVYLWFICQIIMCYMTMFICTWIGKLPNALLKPVLYCGQCSMLILALHPVLAWITVKCLGSENEILLTKSQLPDGYIVEKWMLIISVFVAIAICCIAKFLLKRMNLIHNNKKMIYE